MEELEINTEDIVGINESLNIMVTAIKKYQKLILGNSYSEIFSTKLYKSLLPLSQTFNQEYYARALENIKKSFAPLMGTYNSEEYAKMLKNLVGVNTDFQKAISAFTKQQEEILGTQEWSKI